MPKIYSQDLVNNLFRHPYTKIEFVMDELQVHRNTASRYLDELVGIGLLTKHRLGKENFYLNDALFQLLIGCWQQALHARRNAFSMTRQGQHAQKSVVSCVRFSHMHSNACFRVHESGALTVPI
nr:hypothetical protein [Pseudomonas sp. Q2-TVG4-2]